MDRRGKLIKGFMAKNDAFGKIGGSAGDRIKRAGKITEDDPRWNPKTMGNKRGRIKPPRSLISDDRAHNA
jgi:hypothetical protein